MSGLSAYAVVLATYVVLQVVWTLAVRTFPDLVGGVLLKGVEGRNAIKIEMLKDELSRTTQREIERLRADYSTLKSSTDFLSANQAELRAKMIVSTELLWSNILAIGKDFGGVIFLEKIALPSELEDAFALGKWQRLLEPLQAYKNTNDVAQRMIKFESDELTKARLFVGERLWFVHYTFKAVYLRMALLLNRSFVESKYNGWRDDGVIKQHLTFVFGAEKAESFFVKDTTTIHLVIASLEGKFLEEAMRIMSGSKFFADSISDVQSTLLYETARVQEAKNTR